MESLQMDDVPKDINEVYIAINKNSFNKLAVNVNINILTNITAYINILTKIIDYESDETIKTQLKELKQQIIQQHDVFDSTLKQIQLILKINNKNDVVNDVVNDVGNGQAAATIIGTMVAAASLL
jgi:hypothetical protein